MEKISWTNHEKNKNKFRDSQERKRKRRKAQWIGYTVRGKFLLKQVTEGKIEGMGGREKDVSSC
jgi:hypothetical protein